MNPSKFLPGRFHALYVITKKRDFRPLQGLIAAMLPLVLYRYSDNEYEEQDDA